MKVRIDIKEIDYGQAIEKLLEVGADNVGNDNIREITQVGKPLNLSDWLFNQNKLRSFWKDLTDNTG